MAFPMITGPRGNWPRKARSTSRRGLLPVCPDLLRTPSKEVMVVLMAGLLFTGSRTTGSPDWALAQVKGGKFKLGELRDFIHVTERDKAALGCFVTLSRISTPASKREVAELGKVRVSDHEYRRMNLWSIEEFFDDRRPSLPLMTNPLHWQAHGPVQSVCVGDQTPCLNPSLFPLHLKA